MVLHLAISLISSSLIHLVDFLDPLINFYFLHLNLILKLMVAGLLLLLHLLFGMHFHSNLDLVIPFLLLNLSLRLGYLKFRGGSRGRVQGVHPPPPPPEMICGFLIQLIFCKKKTMWFFGVEEEVSYKKIHNDPKALLDHCEFFYRILLLQHQKTT